MSEQRRSSGNGPGLRSHVRYRFDNLLARGTWAVLLWLGVVTLVAVLVSSSLLAVFGVDFAGSQDSSWLEDFWQSLLRVFDPGTMAADVGWGRRVLALLVTIFGILIAGTLIGLIANGVEQRVEAMRRGRSTVVETGHVVVLGVSTRLPVVVEQLALAGRGRRSNAIVVLSDLEPVQLNEEVRAAVDDLHGSRVVFRSGDPARRPDLRMVALRDARAVIVLADDAHGHGDGGVVRAVLAAGAELGAFDRIPIVAEMSDPAAADSLLRACGGAIHTVVPSQSVARLTAFALREPGLIRVIEELLDFRGCDVYVRPVDGLAGASFADCVFRFTTARPIGRIRPAGEIEVNPDPGTRLETDDQLIIVDEDGSGAPQPTAFAAVPPPSRATSHKPVAPRQEHVLILGWSVLGPPLLVQVAAFATPGSSAEVVYDATQADPPDLQIPGLGDFDVTLRPASGTWTFDDVEPMTSVTSIVLLADRRDAAPDEVDGRTLLHHMLLRRHLDAARGPSPRVIVELRDSANLDLARLTGADDYVVSDAITSRLMTQLAEQPRRRDILLRLYAADGPSVRLVRVGELDLSGTVEFGDVIATAYAAGLLALGWRSGDEVVLNPPTSERMVLAADDQIVVIG
ncbi:MAG TPA: hypothetical protein VK923_00560 [Euzebyales bacterium]|nr:hypothetical protein [Euzebyales bacterium]